MRPIFVSTVSLKVSILALFSFIAPLTVLLVVVKVLSVIVCVVLAGAFKLLSSFILPGIVLLVVVKVLSVIF